jgi:hypothetical protein
MFVSDISTDCTCENITYYVKCLPLSCSIIDRTDGICRIRLKFIIIMKAVIYLKMLLLTFSIDEKVVCGQIYEKV